MKKSALNRLILLLLLLAPLAYAQNGLGLNSIDAKPGTSAPVAPSDPANIPDHKPTDGAIRFPKDGITPKKMVMPTATPDQR